METHYVPSANSRSPGTTRSLLLGVLLVAQLMVIPDISAVNVALPDLCKRPLHQGART